jgi:hypothetical protein
MRGSTRKEHTMVHSLRSGLKKIGYILNGRGIPLQTFSYFHEFIAEMDKAFHRRQEGENAPSDIITVGRNGVLMREILSDLNY